MVRASMERTRMVSHSMRKLSRTMRTFDSGELIQRTADELLESKNFGMTSLTEVREKLRQYGLSLRGD